MSIQFIDGFETEKNIDQRYEVYGQGPNWAISIDTVNSGTNALRLTGYLNNYNTNVAKHISPTSKVIVGFAYRADRVGASTHPFFYFYKKTSISPTPSYGRTEYSRITINSSGKAELYFMNTKIATGTKTYSANTWYYFENKLEFTDTTTFTYILRVDETYVDISCTRSDFTLIPYNTIDVVMWYAYSSDANVVNMYLDDIYILDSTAPLNDFIGKCSVLGVRVNDVDTANDFTPSTLSDAKYNLLKEMTVDKNTYVYDKTVGTKQFFTMEDIGNVGAIKGVMVNYYVQKDDPYGPTLKYKPLIKDATNTEIYKYISDLTNNDQSCQSFIYENNPFTDATQDSSAINDLLVGVEITQI